MLTRIGLFHHPKMPHSLALAREVEALLKKNGRKPVIVSAWDQLSIQKVAPELDLAITFGGDGTILRAARIIAPLGMPLLGVNLGKLGFLAELSPYDLLEKLPSLMDGNYWLEERAMLKAALLRQSESAPSAEPGGAPIHKGESLLGLNDVVVGRGILSRVVRLDITIDDAHYGEFLADGVVIATATGSTGYSFAASGPVLHPQLSNILLTPICPHRAMARSLVLPPDAVVQVKVFTDHQAVLTVDGQIDIPMQNGDGVVVAVSSYRCRFLRGQPKGFFYPALAERLIGNRYQVGPED